MKRNHHFYVVLLLIFSILPSFSFAQKTKIACVGNSITEGIGATSGSTNYPAVLQRNLETTNYEVKNFGASGHTLMKSGNSPYWNHERYQKALNYTPDIIVIKLGTNDAKPNNWVHKDQYVKDYIELINSFKNLSSQPKIYICYPLPLFGPNNWIADDAIVTGEMMPMIDRIAQETGATIIDCHTPFEGKAHLTTDKVHPNDKGYLLLAHVVGSAIAPQEVPELPEDFFLQLAPQNRTDLRTNSDSSMDGIDMNLILDNNGQTGINAEFIPQSWFSIDMPPSNSITTYSVTSGADASAAPRSWMLQGSTTGKRWQPIDEQTAIAFAPNETRIFHLNMYHTFPLYRLMVSENNGSNMIAINEWQLFGHESPQSTSIMNNGGKVTAQFNTIANEGIGNLIDGNVKTKFCTQVQSGNSVWVRYDSPIAVKIGRYSLTSAYNAPDRDPVTWTLYGSNDEVTWDVLDRQQAQFFAGSYSTMEYPVQTDKVYKNFKIVVAEKRGYFQLSEWQLFEASQEVGIKAINIPELAIHTERNHLTITSESDDSSHYEIFSLNGDRLSKGKIAARTHIKEYLPSGSYLVALNAQGRKDIKKVIISN